MGITCIGAPVRDVSGKIIAAMSVSFPCFRFPENRSDEIISAIKNAALEISGAMGYK
jgi:IclR family KDG regulon transcriptional repressor